MEDLFKALQLFQQGVQQYATSSAIAEATKTFQDLNKQVQQGAINEQQGRQAFQSLSDQLALRLAGTGATGTQIQTAFNVISPQKFGSAEQMQLEGALSGSPLLQKSAQDIIKQREQQKLNLIKEDYRLKQELLHEKKPGLKPLPSNTLENLSKFEETAIQGRDILGQLESDPYLSGPVASRVPLRDITDPAYASFKSQIGRFFDAYRVGVTGAGASPGELKILRENVPVETDTPSVLKAKMKKLIEAGERVRNRRLQLYEKAGYNTQSLQELFGSEGAQQQQQSAPKEDLLNKYRVK